MADHMTDRMTREGDALYWPPLSRGTLIRRYKRFLADIRLDSGETVTAHCANSGAMTACCDPGSRVWVSRTDDPRRKLAYTWRLIDMNGLIGVHTQVPNPLVAATFEAGRVPGFEAYNTVKREVKVGNSRIDLLLQGEGLPDCFVEVKNCTLVEEGVARFPDAVTTRGKKHVEELRELAETGTRAAMFILIQRMDATVFRPAWEVDPAYSRALVDAVSRGVELLCFDCEITLETIRARRPVPVDLRPMDLS